MIFETQDSIFSSLEKLDFSLSSWLNYWYPKICDFLSISPEHDEDALKRVVSQFQSNFDYESIAQMIAGKKVFIIAPGPNLENEFEKLLTLVDEGDSVTLCADGATSYLLANNFTPDIIITDLDGKVEDQLKAQERGSHLLVHVHGDNKALIQTFMPAISKGKFVFTTQSLPIIGSHNFLGFTDGDRGVCLSTLMHAKEICLVGFDFDSEVGIYSKNRLLSANELERKRKKFQIAKSIINWCSQHVQIKLIQ